MKRIPESLVRAVVSSSDIVRVIGEYVRLEQRGSRWLGLCPFHNEKSPSFNVNADKGFFYCFGCKKGGDVVTFIKEIEKCGYVEALERLAEKSGIALEYEGEEDPEAGRLARFKESLYELYERLTGTFHHLLVDDERGTQALEYALSRGLTMDTVKAFKLGFIPQERGWLYRFLKSKSYSDDFLADSGLFSQKHHDYCIFSGRLLFPIQDHRSKYVGFGGRLLAGDGPKYINSPETAIFKKQDNLFGLSMSTKALREGSPAILCEGYMDAIAFHASGVPCAVAPLGTAFTENQAKLLKRYVGSVILCFDSDEAGRKAAERSIGIAEVQGFTVRALRLSSGKDPAELMQKFGAERLKKEAESTITADDFLLGNAQGQAGAGDAEGIARAFSYLFPFIADFSSEIRRDTFLDASAARFKVDPASVRADFARFLKRRVLPTRIEPATVPGFKPTADADLLAALAAYPEIFIKIRSELDPSSFDDMILRDAYIALEEGYRQEDLSLSVVSSAIGDDALRSFILERASRGAYEPDPERFIRDSVFRLKERQLREKIKKLVARIRDYDEERDGDETSLNDLLYEKMYLDGELTRLKEERHGRA